MQNIKNILIFLTVGAVFVLIYIFFIKPDTAPVESLVSSTTPSPVAGSPEANNSLSGTEDFLNLLLSVKSIKLDDAIFTDIAFMSLHDSSITLTPDGDEGRPNPFAPFGGDNIAPPAQTATPAEQTLETEGTGTGAAL